MHPSVNSPQGAGAVDLTMTLQSRDVVASAQAFEVRRGWTGPYGGAVAGSAPTRSKAAQIGPCTLDGWIC